jgi:hypothetical protein
MINYNKVSDIQERLKDKRSTKQEVLKSYLDDAWGNTLEDRIQWLEAIIYVMLED